MLTEITIAATPRGGTPFAEIGPGHSLCLLHSPCVQGPKKAPRAFLARPVEDHD